MLEHKRTLFVRVALEADGVLRGRSPHLMRFHCSMNVVAIAALDQSFIHAMMERHVELGFLLEMARVAELRLHFPQKEFFCLRMMRGMAGDAAHIIFRVLGINRIHVLGTAGVASQAASVNFLCGCLPEEEQHGGIGRG